MEDQVKSWMPYVEEIRVIRITCAFCGSEEDSEPGDFTEKSKAEALKELIDLGWEEITADSVEGLACPSCVKEVKNDR
jgi:hypothetical protein